MKKNKLNNEGERELNKLAELIDPDDDEWTMPNTRMDIEKTYGSLVNVLRNMSPKAVIDQSIERLQHILDAIPDVDTGRSIDPSVVADIFHAHSLLDKLKGSSAKLSGTLLQLQNHVKQHLKECVEIEIGDE